MVSNMIQVHKNIIVRLMLTRRIGGSNAVTIMKENVGIILREAEQTQKTAEGQNTFILESFLQDESTSTIRPVDGNRIGL